MFFIYYYRPPQYLTIYNTAKEAAELLKIHNALSHSTFAFLSHKYRTYALCNFYDMKTV